MSFGLSGSTRLVTSTTVGKSGSPFRLFNLHVISGGTASVISVRNGTSASAAIWVKETGTANTGATFDYGEGILLSSGCFISTDANTTSVIISGRTES